MVTPTDGRAEYQFPASIKIHDTTLRTGLFVSAFMMDMSRADVGWVKEFVRALRGSGAVDSLAIVDTMGICTTEKIRSARCSTRCAVASGRPPS